MMFDTVVQLRRNKALEMEHANFVFLVAFPML